MSLVTVLNVAVNTSTYTLIPKAECRDMTLRMRDASAFLVSDSLAGTAYFSVPASQPLLVPLRDGGYEPTAGHCAIYVKATVNGTLEVLCSK